MVSGFGAGANKRFGNHVSEFRLAAVYPRFSVKSFVLLQNVHVARDVSRLSFKSSWVTLNTPSKRPGGKVWNKQPLSCNSVTFPSVENIFDGRVVNKFALSDNEVKRGRFANKPLGKELIEFVARLMDVKSGRFAKTPTGTVVMPPLFSASVVVVLGHAQLSVPAVTVQHAVMAHEGAINARIRRESNIARPRVINARKRRKREVVTRPGEITQKGPRREYVWSDALVGVRGGSHAHDAEKVR